MRNIVRIRFGSHLYGTATPASDLDFKSIHIPDARNILLQRAARSVSTKRPKSEGEKNYAGEVDEESYSLQHYLKLLAEGQTVATDVLFAPDWSATEPPSEEWRTIFANRHRLVTRKSQAFVGYCRQQANKYGIKGSRVAAARSALATLDRAIELFGTTAKVRDISGIIAGEVETHDHMEVVKIPLPSGVELEHWEVCGRKMPYTTSLKSGRDMMEHLVAEYGQRALQAESQQGVDWKALSHAVRVGRQAVELLQTGEVTFPSPNAGRLVAIKTGQLPYQTVAAEIEEVLLEVEESASKSTLRAEPDREWIDDFVTEIYRKEIARAI